MRVGLIVLVASVVTVLGACSTSTPTNPPGGEQETTTSLLSTTSSPVTTTTATEASSTTTTLALASDRWIGTTFTTEPDPQSPSEMHQWPAGQIVTEDGPTGLWVWHSGYPLAQAIVVAPGPNPHPYWADHGTSTTTADEDAGASFDAVVWSVSNSGDRQWTVKDTLPATLSSSIGARGPCRTDQHRRVLALAHALHPDLREDSGDGAIVIAFSIGPGGRIEVVDPSLVNCNF